MSAPCRGCASAPEGLGARRAVRVRACGYGLQSEHTFDILEESRPAGRLTDEGARMGRNAPIKHYALHPEGQPIDLFARGARSPVVAELLSSAWISRASDLLGEEDRAAAGGTGKRARREVEDRFWWDPEAHVSRRCFRVLARAGVWDLAWDRISRTWSLVGIGD